MNPKLWMLVGVPGSGKSTWIRNGIVSKNDFIASTDDYIQLEATLRNTTYDEIFKGQIKNAEKVMYMELDLAVKAGNNIIWDQTNLTRKSRAKKLAMIPDNYQKIAVVFPTPSESELKRRLASRPGKTIPESVVRSMIAQFEAPSEDEGFDYVISAS